MINSITHSVCSMATLEWIYSSYGCSFIILCMLRLLLYMFRLQLLLSSVQLIFYLCTILLSCHLLIASVPKVSFIRSGSVRTCNFPPPLLCQQPPSCMCCMQVYYLLLLLMVLLTVMLLPFHIDILFREELDVFIDRQVHNHLIDCIPNCALNYVIDSTLMEANVAMLLRSTLTLVIPRDIATIMTRNMSI